MPAGFGRRRGWSFGLKAIVAACVLGACACEDASQELEIGETQVRECKSGLPDDELLSGGLISAYEGLHCLAWNFEDASPAIDLLSHSEACGWGGHDEESRSLWKPVVHQKSASDLEVRWQWDFEVNSACGGCLHDFSLELEGELSVADTVELTVATSACTGECGWTSETVELPIGEEPRGIVCNYVKWSDPNPRDTGRLHTPPRNGVCDDGLGVADTDDDDDVRELCLAVCEENSDCPLPDLQRCADGLCWLEGGW